MQLAMHMVTIEDLMPQGHFLRKLEAALDLSFVYEETARLYNRKLGRPPIDPVVIVKYLLVGFLYGIPSERQIEQRIQTILRNGTNRIDTSVFAKELLPKDQTSFCVAYYATQAGPDRNAAGNISEAMLKNLQTIAERCYRYESGCLLIFCEEASGAGDALEKRAQMRLQCYLADGVVGISAVHARPDELVFAFIEAMSSVEYCRLHALPMASFQNIGIYRLLLPYCHDYWMCQYCESLLESLCGKDGQLEEELLQTALLYLRLQGNVPQIAQQLHLHENTVRYRMRKLQARLEHVHAWNDGALKLILCYYELKKRALPW